MVDFSDRDDLEHTLNRLCNRDIPYCIRLSQQAGQRGERFSHLYSGMPDHWAASGATVSANSAQHPEPANALDKSFVSTTQDDLQSDTTEIQALKNELAQTNEELRTLKQQLLRLYQLTGHK
jgi:uncharacterized protein YceH (UPF0502 family)